MPPSSALVATLGTSASVVTRVLDYLLFGPAAEALHEVVIVHTRSDRVLEELEKILRSFPGTTLSERDGARVCEAATYRMGEQSMCVHLRCVAIDAKDFVDERSCDNYLAMLCREVWRLRRAERNVIVSIAGGRKHASAYGMLAAMLFGASRVLHVLTKPAWMEEEKQNLPHVDLAHYDVLTVPFPPLYRGNDDVIMRDPPVDNSALIEGLRSFCTRLPALVALGRAEADGDPGGTEQLGFIKAASPAMKRVLEMAQAHAPHLAPLYIWGSPGSGRSLLAKVIHAEGCWKGRFTEVAGHSLTAESLRGMRADADQCARQPGHFEACTGGTLFIDQIEEMSHAGQRALLPLLAQLPSAEFEGDAGVERARVRLICSGTRPLNELKAAGVLVSEWARVRFAQDIRVPPLSERVADLKYLAEALVAENRSRFATPAVQITGEMLAAMEQFPWGGLQIANLAEALQRWASDGHHWSEMLAFLEAQRPAWEAQELRERQIVEAWHRIRRSPREFDAVRRSNPGIVRELVDYAWSRWLADSKSYPAKTRDGFCRYFFGAPYKRLTAKQR